MRPFEIIALVSLLGYLLANIFGLAKRQKSVIYLAYGSFIAIVGHLYLESYRWQMIPAYVVTGIFVLHAFLKRNKGTSNLWLRGIGWSLASLLQVIALFLPFALPVIQFPTPPGPYKVGRVALYMEDESRKEFVTTEDTTDYRIFVAHLYYPTSAPTGRRAKYIPDFYKVSKAFQNKLDWPLFLLEYLSLIEIEAYQDAPAINAKENYPLVVYSHGLSNNYTEASARLVNIASKGYAVLAINHTYGSNFSLMPEGKVLGFKELSRLGDPLDFIDSTRTLRVKQWVADMAYGINTLKSMNNYPIDFNNIGLLGFSNGGSTADLGATLIPNVKVSINLDGTPRGHMEQRNTNTDYLFMLSEREYYTDEQLKAWGITREMVDAPMDLKENRMLSIAQSTSRTGLWIKIPGTKHSNFIEYPLISPFSEVLRIGGSINSWDCYEIINDYIYVFLDNALKGTNKPIPNYEGLEVKSNQQ